MFVPPVNTQAPVVFAAFNNPLRNTFFNLGCISKFAFPPCIVINNLGSSRPHSRVNRCNINSGRVSCDNLTY